jgi:hypothetical protein
MNGVITTENVYENKEEFLEKIKAYRIKDAIKNCTVKEPQYFPAENGKYHVRVEQRARSFFGRGQAFRRAAEKPRDG